MVKINSQIQNLREIKRVAVAINFQGCIKRNSKLIQGGSERTQKSKRARIKRTKLFKICHFLTNIHESPSFLPFQGRTFLKS